MARRPPSAAKQFQTDEAAFTKLAEKFDGYKALIEVTAPTERNIEAAVKFVLRLVDHWTRWEQSTRKLGDETRHPDCRFCEEEDETFAHLLNECQCFYSYRRDMLYNKPDINTLKWKPKTLLEFSYIPQIDESLTWE